MSNTDKTVVVILIFVVVILVVVLSLYFFAKCAIETSRSRNKKALGREGVEGRASESDASSSIEEYVKSLEICEVRRDGR